MKKIILASSSPRRKQLLSQIGIDFTIDPHNSEEKLNPRLKSKGQAEFLSKQKAQIIAEKHLGEEGLVLGVDSVIDFQGETLGKPKTETDARHTLHRLSGEMHTAITAFTILDLQSKRMVTKSVETKVYMRRLSKKEIDAYVRSRESMGQAGSYAIQGKGKVFVERIEGDFYNVVGLPLTALTEELKRYGVTIF